MKFLVCLITLISAVQGEFQYFRSSRASVSTVCTSSTVSKTFCASGGCGNELILCLGPNFGVSINCTAQSPYCVENTPGQAQCIETCGSDFSCTGEGIFPDPLDCKRYHFCHNVNNNLVSQSYSCPDRYVFDPDAPATSYCRYTNNFYCTLPKCGNQIKNVLFLYPFFPYNRQYVALCIPSSKPVVFKCQDGYTADLSTIPVTCNFKCKTPGLFPNPDDSTKYFECYYNANQQLVMRPGTCFPGYIFVINKCQAQSTLSPNSTLIPTELTTTSNSQIESTTPVPIQPTLAPITTLSPIQSQSTTSDPIQSETESTMPVPSQSETESTMPVPSQSETESTIPVPSQSETESTMPVPSETESTTPCIRPSCD